ncbi:hypothetical protein KUV73_10700 [Mameliella alba]|nr:hypothetical protein [Mameliella alba]MBY6170191.1 hypothetical protein [Mameliella alba]MBY6174832.1 hypothetical protein [Mameliella alba]
MTSETERITQLCNVIRDHSACSRAKSEGAISSYAAHILTCNDHPERATNVAIKHQVHQLETLDRTLRKVHDLIVDLSPETSSELAEAVCQMVDDRETSQQGATIPSLCGHCDCCRALAMLQHMRETLGTEKNLVSADDLLNRRMRSLQSLREAVANVRTTFADRQEVGKKGNNRGKVVCWACTKVWEELHPGATPSHLNASRGDNSGFGAFVKAVFDVLGIGMLPSSALDALNKHREKYGELHLSVEIRV